MPAQPSEPVKPRANPGITDYALIKGCQVSDNCLECPLTMCQFDDSRLFQRKIRSVKAEILRHERSSEQISTQQIAQRYGLSLPAAQRMLSLPSVTDAMTENEAKVLTRLAREQLERQRRPDTP